MDGGAQWEWDPLRGVDMREDGANAQLWEAEVQIKSLGSSCQVPTATFTLYTGSTLASLVEKR